MNTFRFGCQTYTWQMSYEKYRDGLDGILDTVRDCGFAGLEPEVCMLGKYRTEPARLREALVARKLELGALCLVCDWRQPSETVEERAEADRVIRYLAESFPQTVLALCQMPGKDRRGLAGRQANCLSCINAVAARAAGAGLTAAFHPNSPAGSVFRTAEDYRVMLDGLDEKVLGFAPDAGHIAKGGMDPVTIFRDARRLIRHVHFKDLGANGKWALLGEGTIDYPALLAELKAAGYRGWVMVEDESPLAETDPNAATAHNGRYLQAVG